MVTPVSDWTQSSLSLNDTALLPLWFLACVVFTLRCKWLWRKASVKWRCRIVERSQIPEEWLKILILSYFRPLLFYMAFKINYFYTHVLPDQSGCGDIFWKYELFLAMQSRKQSTPTCSRGAKLEMCCYIIERFQVYWDKCPIWICFFICL